MQRGIRINESQLLMLADKARHDNILSGYLYKRSSDSSKWQMRWFMLYQNLLLYYEADTSPKPSGMVFLEGCYCDRLITTGQHKTKDSPEAQRRKLKCEVPTPVNMFVYKQNGGHRILKMWADVYREYLNNKHEQRMPVLECKCAVQGNSGKHCFAITYRQEGLRQYELCAKNESDCNIWIESIKQASFNKVLLQKEELEQKYLHLLQIVESEKTAKWQYTQQCEELTMEIKKLRTEVDEICSLKKESRPPQTATSRRFSEIKAEDTEEIKKIKKVQSFFRGWLCRRRWKQIVDEYIHSPHAESMRKRNSLVFRLVESEEEYLEQLELLVSCVIRPFKMAASSKKPPCSHDDLNSIFLNSETVMFLHQIFLKGLTARMENWPTLVLGDLFNMLLPMLCIYQEYVRNHHYSLQVLTECKQNSQFAAMLKRLEEKPAFNGRSIETFLTYPMHQIPRYIITIHELLAHTPHNHVERKSLDEARVKLEELSRQMHDEVSETENIRKNLAIERMIVEGCDILLDVNQVFVRQGSLIQIPVDKPKGQWNRISSFKAEKETVRQCFLFTNHMLLTTRSSGGRLHLVPNVGKIALSDAILIEDPSELTGQDDDGESSSGSLSSQSSDNSPAISTIKHNYQNLDFKLVVDVKGGPPAVVHLAAATMQEKAGWISDISHCMDNVHFNDLFHSANNDTSSVTMPQSIRNDPKLFKDDVDIRFSRTLNSCKVPQIRYATPKRLLERLTDLRFLSIDFLNTFMLTYRVFTDGITVLEALKKVYYNPELRDYPESRNNSIAYSSGSLDVYHPGVDAAGRLSVTSVMSWDSDCHFRRISTVSTGSAMSEGYDREREHSIGHASHISTGSCGPHWKYTHRKYEEEQHKMPKENSLAPPGSGSGIFHHHHGSMATTSSLAAASVASSGLFNVPPTLPSVAGAMAAASASLTSVASLSSNPPVPPAPPPSPGATTYRLSDDEAGDEGAGGSFDSDGGKYLSIPKAMVASLSSETLSETTISAPSSPSSVTTMSTSTHTLVPAGSDELQSPEQSQPQKTPQPTPQPKLLLQATPPPLRLEPPPPPKSPKAPKSPKSPLAKGKEQIFLLIAKLEQTQKSSLMDPSKDAKEKRKNSGKELTFAVPTTDTLKVRISAPRHSQDEDSIDGHLLDRHRRSTSSTGSSSYYSTSNGQSPHLSGRKTGSKRGSGDTESSSFYTPRGSFMSSDSPQHSSKAGVVVTSSRPSQRRDHQKLLPSALTDSSVSPLLIRSSTSSAAAAFAVATAGCSNPRDQLSPPQRTTRFLSAGNTDVRFCQKRDSMMNSAATMRVLRVLRHWVSKHSQDFEHGPLLKQLTLEFLEELVNNVNLLPAEHKAAAQLLQMMTKEENNSNKVDLDVLLAQPTSTSKENIETLSALEIAEQMTLLDHKIFISIRSEEFLGQAWMKPDKTSKTPNILLITKRFNDVSRLVVSEIICRPNLANRISVIEKWAAVADICRCLHNFNGVLQICAAFVNSSVFRLKKTWEKVSKTTRQTVDKLQTLVSSDGRFRNLREALHRCDPPCIPYLGMYLTDLSFIEEGTPNFTDDGLLNFSKMRMIAHVIREIRHFQQTPYKIELSTKVTNYLLDTCLLVPEDELYRMSLNIEPRQSRLSTTTLHNT